MKLKFLIKVVIFCGIINSINCKTLFCTFTDGPYYSIVGNPYQCKVENETKIVNEYHVINDVNGRQYDANSHSEVQMLWVTGTTFHYIPFGIGKFFDNLEAIWIRYGGLKKLEHEKMKQFPNLRYLYLRYNSIRVLKPDVFKGNPKLEWIDFKGNRLTYVDGEIFLAFTKLQNLNFKKNYCIDQQHNIHHGKFISHDTLLHVKYVIDMNCHLPQEIYCSLYNMSHQGTEYFSCSSKGTAINHNNVTISRVLHNKNETYLKDIHGLAIHNQNFTNFPRNLHKFFPGLMAIQIVNCGLRNLTFDDVKHYTNLKTLWLPLNHIEALEKGIFNQNLKLEKFTFYGNNLKKIDSNVLKPLKFLLFVSFEKNNCIDMAANNEGDMEVLKGRIAWFCTGN
ncbi:hypothetical protein ACKWTF_016732 [Chironomus riparius]